MSNKLKTTQSWKLWDRAAMLIPCGTQTLSKAPNQFAEGIYPVYLERGLGSHVWDVDGNEFIDFPLALGCVILGYQNPAVNEAIHRQLEKGSVFSLMHPLEIELAQEIAQLVPCAQRVRFTKTGSEATQAAIRIARATTGRKKILACGYHGWHDWYVGVTPRNKGVPEEIASLIQSFPYNNVSALERMLEEQGNIVAAVIMEPVGLEAPKDGFLQKVRELTKRHGVVLIFDEIITGFRFHLGGAQTIYGVTPDLATMGKAIANGLPLYLVCGKADVMKACDEVFFSSTFGGECLSLAAALATIREMKQLGTVEHLWKQGNKILEQLRAEITRLGVPAEIVGFGPRQFFNFFGPDRKLSPLLKSIFWQETVERGMLFGNAQFICQSHSDEDIERAIAASKAALAYVAKAVESKKPEQWYRGRLPAEIFRKP